MALGGGDLISCFTLCVESLKFLFRFSELFWFTFSVFIDDSLTELLKLLLVLSVEFTELETWFISD